LLIKLHLNKILKIMALQKEIWINSIIENLFPDNTFAVRSVNHSAFADNKTIHVPNAGALPAVSKTRPFAAGANLTAGAERTDIDLSYDMEIYYIGPVVIPNAESIELSYAKRESVLVGVKTALQQAALGDLIYKWVPTSGTTLATTGANVAPHIASATGNRKSLTKADIRALRTQFDKWDCPQEGRCLLIDADMYGQLLGNLTEAEANAFLACANAQTGVIGKLYSFDIYIRSQVAKAAAGGAIKLWSAAAAATDSAAGLAWCESMVSRSNGDVNIYDNAADALAFGDVLSGDLRAGGKHMRNDKKGVVLLYQGTPAA
jgi:hypothetical protein